MTKKKLRFKEKDSKTGFIVFGEDDVVIGQIVPHKPWKEMVFSTIEEAYYSHDCLDEIVNYLEFLNTLNPPYYEQIKQ